MPDIRKIVKMADVVDDAIKAKRAANAAEKAAVAAKSAENLPVIVQHPLDPAQKFTFPVGTDPKVANDLVRKILLVKARHGEQKIELPSSLTPDRLKHLEDKEKEAERLKDSLKQLESKKDISKVQPGLYLDENTGKYWTVDDQGKYVEAQIGVPGK